MAIEAWKYERQKCKLRREGKGKKENLGECQHVGIKPWKRNLKRDGEEKGKSRSSCSRETKMIKLGERVKQQRSLREDSGDADWKQAQILHLAPFLAPWYAFVWWVWEPACSRLRSSAGGEKKWANSQIPRAPADCLVTKDSVPLGKFYSTLCGGVRCEKQELRSAGGDLLVAQRRFLR